MGEKTSPVLRAFLAGELAERVAARKDTLLAANPTSDERAIMAVAAAHVWRDAMDELNRLIARTREPLPSGVVAEMVLQGLCPMSDEDLLLQNVLAQESLTPIAQVLSDLGDILDRLVLEADAADAARLAEAQSAAP